MLAEIVRLDRDHHRPVAGDSGEVEGLKLVARTHQSLIWDRTRHLQRLRQALREYFPGVLDALAAARIELGDPDALELIERAPDPDRAARLSRSKIATILQRNRRRDVEARAEAIQAVLRAAALRQPGPVESAYATIAGTQVRLLVLLIGQIPQLEEVLAQGFGRHPDAGARKNYAGTSPITRSSGRKTVVLARYARNRRLATRSTSGPSAPSTTHPAPAPTTTRSELAASVTTPRYPSSATDWSGSCMAASPPTPTTTRPPAGPTTQPSQLDTTTSWDG